MGFPVALSLSCCLTVAAAFTVYDCDKAATSYKVVDLREPKSCPDPETDFQPVTQFRTQVIQANSDLPVRGFQCSASVTRRITRCGFDHLTYAHDVPIFMESIPISAGLCRDMVTSGSFTYDNRIHNLKAHKDNHYSYFSHGSTTDDGK